MRHVCLSAAGAAGCAFLPACLPGLAQFVDVDVPKCLQGIQYVTGNAMSASQNPNAREFDFKFYCLIWWFHGEALCCGVGNLILTLYKKRGLQE